MSENRKVWPIRVWGILLMLASGVCFSDLALPLVQNEFYAIHAASFRRKSDADFDISRFRTMGHETFYRKTEVPGKGSWYRVYIGCFAKKSEARLLGEDMKSKGVLSYYSIQKFDDALNQRASTPTAYAAAQESLAPQPPQDDVVIHQDSPKQLPVLPKRDDAGDGEHQSTDRPILQAAPVEMTTDAGKEAPLKTYPVPKPAASNSGLSENPLFDEALKAFESSDYEKALEIFTATESGQAENDALKEQISRRIADCYYFLAPHKGNSFFMIAAERYKKILLEHPNRAEDEDGFYRLGRSYDNLKFYYEALEAYRLLIVNYPDTVYAAEVNFRIGEMLYKIGRFDQAIDHLKNWQRLYPDDVHAKTAAFLIADTYYKLRQAVNAENRYREAMQRWPDYGDIDVDILLNMGMHHFQNHQYADAAHVFSLVASLYPDDARIPGLLYDLGKILDEAGRPKGALMMLGLVRETYPQTSDQASQLLADMGILNPGIRMFEFAGADAYLNPVSTYDALIEKSGIGEKTAELMAKKAEALRKTGQLFKCVGAYSELLARFPAGQHEEASRYKLKTVTQTLVKEYFQNGRDLAVAELYFKTYGQDLIRFDVSDLDTGLMLAESLVNIGLPRIAKMIYAELQGICRNASCSGRIVLGQVRADAADGRNQDASDRLFSLIANPVGLTTGQVRETKILAADILFDLKRYSEAADFYGEVLHDENNASENRIFLQYGAALRHAGNVDASYEVYQRVIQRCLKDDQTPDSQWMQAYTGLGECCYLQKRYADGIAAFEKALTYADTKERAWPLYQLIRGGLQVNDQVAVEKRLAELHQTDAFWAQAAQRWIEESSWRDTNQTYLQ